jgi:hypothetical protein
MEVDFGANQTPVTEQAANPKAQPTVETSAVATVPRTGGLMLGDHIPDFSEIVFPRLNISQAIGELKDEFAPGTLVFDRKLAIFTPPILAGGRLVEEGTEPATITVIGFRPTQFAEKVEGGLRGLIVNNEKDVLTCGGTTNYKEWELKKNSGIKYFQHLATALCLVERPSYVKDDDTIFNFEVEGKKYTFALWSMKGASYTAAAKKVFFTKRSMGSLKKGYPTFAFSVSTKFSQWSGGKEAWVPVCVEKEKNSEAMLTFLRDFLTGTPSESSEASS